MNEETWHAWHALCKTSYVIMLNVLYMNENVWHAALFAQHLILSY